MAAEAARSNVVSFPGTSIKVRPFFMDEKREELLKRHMATAHEAAAFCRLVEIAIRCDGVIRRASPRWLAHEMFFGNVRPLKRHLAKWERAGLVVLGGEPCVVGVPLAIREIQERQAAHDRRAGRGPFRRDSDEEIAAKLRALMGKLEAQVVDFKPHPGAPLASVSTPKNLESESPSPSPARARASTEPPTPAEPSPTPPAPQPVAETNQGFFKIIEDDTNQLTTNQHHPPSPGIPTADAPLDFTPGWASPLDDQPPSSISELFGSDEELHEEATDQKFFAFLSMGKSLGRNTRDVPGAPRRFGIDAGPERNAWEARERAARAGSNPSVATMNLEEAKRLVALARPDGKKGGAWHNPPARSVICTTRPAEALAKRERELGITGDHADDH